MNSNQPQSPSIEANEAKLAQEKIKALRFDTEFCKRLLSNDVETKASWEALHRTAFPGTIDFSGITF